MRSRAGRGIGLLVLLFPAGLRAATETAPAPSIPASPAFSPTIPPSPTPGPLELWSRVSPPAGLEGKGAADEDVVKYLIKINNLLIDEPEALDGNPEAARALLSLLPRYDKLLAAKKVKTQALRRLIQGVPSLKEETTPAPLPSPVAAGLPETERAAIKASLDRLQARVAALEEARIHSQSELDSKMNSLQEGQGHLDTALSSVESRLSAQESKSVTMELSFQKLSLETAAAKESAESVKVGLAAQQALAQRLSSDLEADRAGVQKLEQEKQNLRKDLDALKELIRVSQAGAADTREDIQYLRDQLEKGARKDEAQRKEKAPGLLRHPAIPGAALILSLVALIIAL